MSGAKKVFRNASVSIYEIMERCSLNESDELELKNYVESKGMILFNAFLPCCSRKVEKWIFQPTK
jgi:N-acetylneuraminate synthase